MDINQEITECKNFQIMINVLDKENNSSFISGYCVYIVVLAILMGYLRSAGYF